MWPYIWATPRLLGTGLLDPQTVLPSRFDDEAQSSFWNTDCCRPSDDSTILCGSLRSELISGLVQTENLGLALWDSVSALLGRLSLLLVLLRCDADVSVTSASSAMSILVTPANDVISITQLQ